MAGLEIKSFDAADETVASELGSVAVVTVGTTTVGRETFAPGWRWSTHVRPLVGSDRCGYHHVGVQISGRCAYESADGEVREVGPGDVYDIAPGHDTWVIGDEPSVNIDFQGVAGFGKAADSDRVLTTLLMSDIVGSTPLAQRIGDAAWRSSLLAHNESMRGLLELHRGVEVKSTGDGFLARFDIPARAARCAIAMASAAVALGIELRIGLHTGEVELVPGDVRGVGVHLVARVMAGAMPNQILATETTRTLAASSGVDFEDLGERDLKGFAARHRLFAVSRANGNNPGS